MFAITTMTKRSLTIALSPFVTPFLNISQPLLTLFLLENYLIYLSH